MFVGACMCANTACMHYTMHECMYPCKHTHTYGLRVIIRTTVSMKCNVSVLSEILVANYRPEKTSCGRRRLSESMGRTWELGPRPRSAGFFADVGLGRVSHPREGPSQRSNASSEVPDIIRGSLPWGRPVWQHRRRPRRTLDRKWSLTNLRRTSIDDHIDRPWSCIPPIRFSNPPGIRRLVRVE